MGHREDRARDAQWKDKRQALFTSYSKGNFSGIEEEKLFTMTVVQLWPRCQERLWVLHSWRYLKLSKTPSNLI